MVTTTLLFLALLAWLPKPPIAWLTGFHQLRHLLVPLALPLGLFALVSGSFLGVSLAVVACFGWCHHFASRLTPRPAQDPVDTVGDLHIVTLNAGDYRSSPEDIVEYLRGVDVDVACLQEVSAAHLEAFDRSLTDEYPYRAYQGKGIGGLALLSKFPIRSADTLRSTGPLSHQIATLNVDGKELKVINAHPFVSIAALGERSSAAEDVRQIAQRASAGAPTIVMGDFNSTDQSRAYGAMESAGLHDAFKTVQGTFGPTFPVAGRYLYLPIPPIVRIDYHWYTDHFVAVESRVGPDTSSDHLPLESTLAWRRDAMEEAERPSQGSAGSQAA